MLKRIGYRLHVMLLTRTLRLYRSRVETLAVSASDKSNSHWPPFQTVATGALRCILATYARCEPSVLVFRAGPHRKPALAWPVGDIPFSLSHNGGLALVAVAGSGCVGIDAERIRSEVEVEDLSRRFFAPAEAAEIMALPPDAQLAAFFTCWTRKEAFVKALGGGLSVPLKSFHVSIQSSQPARLLLLKGEHLIDGA
jgi:4'-phosphopantetheinyl transferase